MKPVWMLLSLLAATGALALSACGGNDDSDESDTAADTGTASEAAPAPEEPPTLDTQSVEAELEQTVDGIELGGAPATIYPPGGGAPEQVEFGGGKVEVKSVICPDDVPLNTGESFDCEIDLNKGDGSAEVTELDSEGKRVEYRLNVETTSAGVSTETKLNGKLSLD
ncbi:MAG TPA: hypothetical protein VFY99_10410 [Solirubrobacterales bacterium]